MPDGKEYDVDNGAAVLGDEDEESDEINVLLVKNKRSPPYLSKDYCKAHKSPTPFGSKADDAVTPVALLEANHVDNMIYAWAFHLQIDLQFHEPPSCQALESMKLSMLPSTPDSLTK